MRLNISHTTTYGYERPVSYGLQEIRMSPQTGSGQTVIEWSVDVQGGTHEASFRDQHGNGVWLVSFAGGQDGISVTCSGIVDVEDTAGVYGPHRGFAPLWYYHKSTPLTHAGTETRKLVKGLRGIQKDGITTLHELSAAILKRVEYKTGATTTDHTAEDALAAGSGVCQDHSHIFIAAARLLGYPARYVSGYLMLDGQTRQDASHAWAEAYLDGLGWIGFDVSNGISPDERYVRLATGLDYLQAAPISGLRFGDHGSERLVVDIQVSQ